jgi:hypothetical protein
VTLLKHDHGLDNILDLPRITYCEHCQASFLPKTVFDDTVIRYVVKSAFRRTLVTDLHTLEHLHYQQDFHPQAKSLRPNEDWWLPAHHAMVEEWKKSKSKQYQGFIKTPTEAEIAEATWASEDSTVSEDIDDGTSIDDGAGGRSLAHDDTPVATEQMLPYVQRLFEAFVDREEIEDGSVTKRVTDLSDLAVELLCWRILVCFA